LGIIVLKAMAKDPNREIWTSATPQQALPAQIHESAADQRVRLCPHMAITWICRKLHYFQTLTNHHVALRIVFLARIPPPAILNASLYVRI
jgi:hypothetical protein